ncbi:MAG: dTDP-4-dehydrorhamnose 3,5-epimerase [Actinobacteria bacterium]|uniref:Unannotated protein n=1 Tax=freshwater metagenome TaxID=449393 RepID=A0A6J7D265_9ZZZZ|nr:dTDP-4-dehydrorhamnose 3,5-epimerase [Actinomycetota bacterium]
MELIPLNIEGSWLAKSAVHSDARGNFREWFKAEDFANTTKRDFSIAQANVSTSSKGTIRGIHYSLAAIGQAKWVTCVAGRINDVIVDIRPSSPTYGSHQVIELSEVNGSAIYIGEGLGHGFIALEEKTVVSYLISSPFSMHEEFEINPLDTALAINWGMPIEQLKLSKKDSEAPTLKQRHEDGKLPQYINLGIDNA